MISLTVTNVTYPAGEGDLINIEYGGDQTDETNRGNIDGSLSDVDESIVKKMLYIWWKARSSDYSDPSEIIGKTIVVNMASNGILVSVG